MKTAFWFHLWLLKTSMMLVTVGREKWRLLSFVQEILQNCFLSYLIASISPGNLRSQTSRSPHISAMAWDKLSPVKTVGMATSVPSSQASPALVNALFERVEEQAEVRTFTLERLRFTFAPNDKMWICTTWLSFPLIFRLLFIASTQK